MQNFGKKNLKAISFYLLDKPNFKYFMEKKDILWIVIPCFNESKVLPVTAPLFLSELLRLIKIGKISEESKIVFVDDGSQDETWQIIKELSKKDKHILGIAQSRNRGHQNAVYAGLMTAKDYADLAISIDCDGQDDISAMEKMVDEYLKGVEIVYGVRSDRSSDSWFKRRTAEAYYKLLRFLGAEVVYNHADYRLTSKRVLREFSNFKEVNLFLRGLFPLLGFKSSTVPYVRKERLEGESHYPLSKMVRLAFEGITSLSTKPIALITILGLVMSLIGGGLCIWAAIVYLIGETVHGWASLMCVVCLIGGVQLLSLGVIGEYVGKIYLETKQRPKFIIEERSGDLWE